MTEVYKFGGSSVGSPGRLTECARIIDKGGKPSVVVVSAPKGVTDLLIAAYQDHHGIEYSGGVLKALEKWVGPEERYHYDDYIRDALQKCFMDTYERVPKAIDLIQESFDMEYPTRFSYRRSGDDRDGFHYANIVSLGEHLNHQLFAIYLNHLGISARAAPMKELMRFDGNPRNATYNRISDPKINSYMNDGFQGVTVMGGFEGFDDRGWEMVFGRGGSDLTQTVVARAIGAKRAINCTDVAGILAIDPRLLPESERPLIPRLGTIDYRAGQQLSRNGARVLHPLCIEQLIDDKIPLEVRSTSDFHGGHTTVTSVKNQEPGVLAVTGIKNTFRTLTLITGNMQNATGYFAQVANAFGDVDVETITTTPIGIQVSTADKTADLGKIKTELKKAGEVREGNGSSLVALVGHHIGDRTDQIATAMSLFHEMDVSLGQISKAGPNGIWMSVPTGRYEDVLLALYKRVILEEQ